MTQYEWCRKKLSEDLYTRQAVINYNQLMHKYDTKDFPCTVSQQFLVNDGKLDTFVNMRSNDLIYGFAYDIIWFIYVQHVLAKDLGLSPGKYWHFTPSLHVYEKDMKIIESICSGD
jgi:thymidylate synthase